jgi:hypothetical protein
VIIALLVCLAVEISSVFMFVIAGVVLAYNIYRVFSKNVEADIVSVFMTTLVSTGVAYLSAGLLSFSDDFPVSAMMLSSMVVLWFGFLVGALAKDSENKVNRIGGYGLSVGIGLFAVAVFMEALNDMTGWSLRADVLSIVAAYIGFTAVAVMGCVLIGDVKKSIISFLGGLSMVMASVGWALCLVLELLEVDTFTWVYDVLAWSFLLPLVAMIPVGVKRIEEKGFYFCEELMHITLSEELQQIGNEAFRYCRKLTSVELPNSVTGIGKNAFGSCDRLDSIYYTGVASDWEWEKVQIADGNAPLTDATIYYYVENQADVPTDGGNYWHYIDGVPTAW